MQIPVPVVTEHETVYVYAIQPREWPNMSGADVRPGDANDIAYFGAGTIRIETGHHDTIPTLPIKVKPYGNGHIKWTGSGNRQMIVRIEFLRDGEESQFSTGIAYFD